MQIKTSPPAEESAPESTGRTPGVDLFLVIGIMAVIAVVVTILLWAPDESKAAAKSVFSSATLTFGPLIQLFGVLSLLAAAALALGRSGTVRLGDGPPQYSTVSWLFMFITAGLGSATMYWAFMEWAYYYAAPGLNITAQTREALDASTAYAFFHWGPIPWAMYSLGGVAMAYHYHVRKGRRLSYAGNMEAVVPRLKANGVAGRIIDLVFLFATFGGLILTVTVTINTVAAGLSNLAGISDTFFVKAVILVISALLFGLSSFIGIDKGLQKLAKAAVLGSLAFAALVLVLGPTEFIVANSVNAIGLEATNFFHMALYTDPIGGGSFSRDWTVFYWLYWLSYLPGVAIFIARVSRGRTIRETILGTTIAGCVGTMFFFGVLSSYAIHQKLQGGIDAPAMLAQSQGELAIAQLIAALPMGSLLSVVYFVIVLLFLASHLDATSYTVAAVSTPRLRDGEDPARSLRLFWVLALSAIPMAMLAIDADLGTLKTGLVLTAIPFACLLGIQTYGLFKWLAGDAHSAIDATPFDQS